MIYRGNSFLNCMSAMNYCQEAQHGQFNWSDIERTRRTAEREAGYLFKAGAAPNLLWL